jgi:hypothetical protein
VKQRAQDKDPRHHHYMKKEMGSGKTRNGHFVTTVCKQIGHARKQKAVWGEGHADKEWGPRHPDQFKYTKHQRTATGHAVRMHQPRCESGGINEDSSERCKHHPDCS